MILPFSLAVITVQIKQSCFLPIHDIENRTQTNSSIMWECRLKSSPQSRSWKARYLQDHANKDRIFFFRVNSSALAGLIDCNKDHILQPNLNNEKEDVNTKFKIRSSTYMFQYWDNKIIISRSYRLNFTWKQTINCTFSSMRWSRSISFFA